MFWPHRPPLGERRPAYANFREARDAPGVGNFPNGPYGQIATLAMPLLTYSPGGAVAQSVAMDLTVAPRLSMGNGTAYTGDSGHDEILYGLNLPGKLGSAMANWTSGRGRR